MIFACRVSRHRFMTSVLLLDYFKYYVFCPPSFAISPHVSSHVNMEFRQRQQTRGTNPCRGQPTHHGCHLPDMTSVTINNNHSALRTYDPLSHFSIMTAFGRHRQSDRTQFDDPKRGFPRQMTEFPSYMPHWANHHSPSQMMQ